MEKILAEFGVQPILLVAQVVNFLVLLFLLKRFLYRPILKVLEKRKDTIAQSLKNAEEIEKRLQKTNEESERIIAKAQNESRKILEESNKAGTQILLDTNKAAEEILQKAQDESLKLIDIERIKLQKEIKENLGTLVAAAFEKVIGKLLTEKQKKEILEKEIRNLS